MNSTIGFCGRKVASVDSEDFEATQVGKDSASWREARQSRGRENLKGIESAASVPEMRRGLFLRAIRGEVSPLSAIKAKCQECCGYEELSSRIGGCTTYRCPLWAYRPNQGGQDD